MDRSASENQKNSNIFGAVSADWKGWRDTKTPQIFVGANRNKRNNEPKFNEP